MDRKIATRAVATRRLAAALAFGAGIVNSAIASDDDNGSTAQVTSSGTTAGALSVTEVVARLAGQGYTDVYKIERERDRYEVKARRADGTSAELSVDARTGEVLRRESDD